MSDHPSQDNDALTEPPPVLGSWKNLYVLVLVNLATLIGLFYALTKAYE